MNFLIADLFYYRFYKKKFNLLIEKKYEYYLKKFNKIRYLLKN